MEMNFSGRYAAIPEHMRFGMEKWVLHGHRPGSFLWAVITNDLRAAVSYADDESLALLPIYTAWFYWEAPLGSAGDTARAATWKGLHVPAESKADAEKNEGAV